MENKVKEETAQRLLRIAKRLDEFWLDGMAGPDSYPFLTQETKDIWNEFREAIKEAEGNG